MTKHRAFHLTAIFFSGFVCCYDNMLSVVYSESLPQLEQNPIGSYLIDTGGVGLFVVVKAVTTVLVVMFLYGLSLTRYRSIVILAAIFQAGLFLYLNFYDIWKYSCSNRTPMGDVIDHYVDPNYGV